MTLTDDDLRALVAARVALAPEPPAPDELRARWERHDPAVATGSGRRPAWVLAGAAATLLVVTVAVVAAGRPRDPAPSDDATIPPAGATVGRYFTLSTLPAGYELLSFTERPGDPGLVEPARSVWIHPASGRRVQLMLTDPADDTAAHTVPLDDGGVARWWDPPTQVAGLAPFPISFTVQRADGFVAGSATGVPEEPFLDEMFAAVRVQDGIPVIDDPAFVLLASEAESVAPIAATWTAIYGPPGRDLGAGSLTLVATRSASPMSVPLEVGLWPDAVELGGRTVYTGTFGSAPRWFADDDVRVELYGSSNVVDLFAGLLEIDAATLVDDLLPEIDERASGLEVAERIEFGTGAVVEYFGTPEQTRGICLEVEGRRRCDLGMMLNAGYTFDNTILTADVDLLIGGRWFTTGVRVDPPADVVPDPVPDGAEVVDVGDRIYYLVERPVDAAVVPSGGLWSTVRPSR